MNASKITPKQILDLKGREKLAVLTAYDYPTTKLLDEAGIPLILVGDSLGMVVLGYPDTTLVTMEDMLHHVRSAARAKPNALLAADMPFESYTTPELALTNAKRLVEAGAEAVKAEGGRSICPQVRAITQAGIPYIGHLGMLPQSVRIEGGYHIKGKRDAEHLALLDDAQALVEAGAFAIVLELVTPSVAGEISKLIPIPTIGIGSGTDCDGQVLVIHDLIGAFPWFTPRFVKPRIQVGESTRQVAMQWKKEINSPPK